MRSLLCLAALGLLLPALARAQNENAPAAGASEVRIFFLPPPMEGTLSLGIYDKGGKLVRTLKSEANPEKDFAVGVNGLGAAWDGKDDQGRPAPAGLYQARGYGVGQIDISGEAILGNDWYDGEETPRLASIVSLDGTRGELLFLTAKLVDGTTAALQCNRLGRIAAREAGAVPETLPGVGRDESTWVIEAGEHGPELRQYSKTKEAMRQLVPAPGDPVPKQVVAVAGEEVLFVLEEKAGEQRVRGLALDETAADKSQSTWKAFLSKRIIPTPDFASFTPELGEKSAFKPEEKLNVHLIPNPLLKEDKRTAVDLKIGLDKRGSYLRTADGLRLIDLSETPGLRWGVIGHDGPSKALTLFQSDGAVVEQFRIRRPANMMAFDAGEYELKR